MLQPIDQLISEVGAIYQNITGTVLPTPNEQDKNFAKIPPEVNPTEFVMNSFQELKARLDQLQHGQSPQQPKFQTRWTPPMEVSECDQYINITLEIPGIPKKDISLAAQNQMLKISGARKPAAEESNQRILFSERHQGKFERLIPLPPTANLSEIKASCKDGCLKIQIQKAAPSPVTEKAIAIS